MRMSSAGKPQGKWLGVPHPLGCIASGSLFFSLVLLLCYGASHADQGMKMGRSELAADTSMVGTDGVPAGQLRQLAIISGRVLLADGTPLSRGLLYLYNLGRGPIPSRDRYWRVPNQVQEIDREGRFSTPVPPGIYAVGAIRRAGGLQIGPAGPGDMFMLSSDGVGEVRRYSFDAGAEVDLGDIREVRWPDNVHKEAGATTAIEGVVTDGEGKPVEGIHVFAFLREVVAGKPLFASEQSNARGEFRLPVAEGGTYFLKARGDLGGGPPQAGLMIDGKKGEPMAAISVETGQVTAGIILRTRAFEGRGRNK